MTFVRNVLRKQQNIPPHDYHDISRKFEHKQILSSNLTNYYVIKSNGFSSRAFVIYQYIILVSKFLLNYIASYNTDLKISNKLRFNQKYSLLLNQLQLFYYFHDDAHLIINDFGEIYLEKVCSQSSNSFVS
jgi:hypothetical protein